MNAVGVKMNVIPSSPASSSNGSSYGKSSSASKAVSAATLPGTVVTGVALSSGAPTSTGGLTREIAESLARKLDVAGSTLYMAEPLLNVFQ